MIVLEIVLIICAVALAIIIDGRIGEDEDIRPTPLMWGPPTLYDFEAEEITE
jgi:hypothetical protein